MFVAIIILFVCVVGYMLLREHLPIVVYASADTQVTVAPGKTGLYELRAAQKVVIPSYNWRTVPTNVVVAPVGTFLFRGRRICLFGNVGCRVYPIPEIKMTGADVLPSVHNDLPRKPIEVIVTNLNPKFPYIARKGAVIAYLEVFRIPRYQFVHIVKEVGDDNIS